MHPTLFLIRAVIRDTMLILREPTQHIHKTTDYMIQIRILIVLVCMYVCKDSAAPAPAHARTRAHSVLGVAVCSVGLTPHPAPSKQSLYTNHHPTALTLLLGQTNKTTAHAPHATHCDHSIIVIVRYSLVLVHRISNTSRLASMSLRRPYCRVTCDTRASLVSVSKTPLRPTPTAPALLKNKTTTVNPPTPVTRLLRRGFVSVAV